jgi:hypothetical protein
MFKTLIAALIALLTGTVITTHQKDKKILELQKQIAYLESYEYFMKIRGPGYEDGYRRGVLDEQLHQIELNANQN